MLSSSFSRLGRSINTLHFSCNFNLVKLFYPPIEHLLFSKFHHKSGAMSYNNDSDNYNGGSRGSGYGDNDNYGSNSSSEGNQDSGNGGFGGGNDNYSGQSSGFGNQGGNDNYGNQSSGNSDNFGGNQGGSSSGSGLGGLLNQAEG